MILHFFLATGCFLLLVSPYVSHNYTEFLDCISIRVFKIFQAVAIFHNYAHKHPIILELFSLKWIPIILQNNYAGTLGSSLIPSKISVSDLTS